MSDNNEFSEKQQEILAKVEKLMRLAAKTPYEAEAATFTAKAQELLEAYNLSADAIDIDGESGSGKRAEEKLIGGFYVFERDLWRSISQLNFVWYFTRLKFIPVEERKFHRGRTHTHQHILIGKVVNIAATKAMASYLMQTIERLTKEQADKVSMPPRSSWAVSFRRGVAERVIEKLEVRRADILTADQKRANDAAKAAREAGSNVETALTLAGVKEREDEGNYDFIHGKGAWAKQKAADLEWQRRSAERRAKAEAEYTQWAAAHPEEAAKQEKERIARERRNASRRRGRYSPGPAFKGDWGAYSMGREVGKNVGIDPQVKQRGGKGLLK